MSAEDKPAEGEDKPAEGGVFYEHPDTRYVCHGCGESFSADEICGVWDWQFCDPCAREFLE